MNAEEAAVHTHRIETDPDYKKRWFDILARTVAVDFDGVIHPYTDGWQGFVPVDEPPMPGIHDFLHELQIKGFNIIVFSTRCDTPQGLQATEAWLVKWDLMKYIEDVTCQKPAAVAYVDDRAVPYKGDFGECLVDVLALAGGRSHGAGTR